MVKESTVNEYRSIEELKESMLVNASDSTVYKKIASFIEQNIYQVLFMTADELASTLSVSQGSVSKFCQAIGYKGYSDFLISLQKLVSKEITSTQRYEYVSGKMHHTDDVIDNEIINLRQLKEIQQTDSYRELVNKLSTSKKVVLLSARMTATILPYFDYVMKKLRDNVEIVVPGSPEWNYLELSESKNETFVMIISLPRYARELIDKSQKLSEEGFDIGVVTDSRYSPLCQYSDLNVFIPRTMASLFDIYSTPLAFMNLLATDVSKQIPGIAERLNKIEQHDNEEKIYYK